jgi:hypothetical protein
MSKAVSDRTGFSGLPIFSTLKKLGNVLPMRVETGGNFKIFIAFAQFEKVAINKNRLCVSLIYYFCNILKNESECQWIRDLSIVFLQID